MHFMQWGWWREQATYGAARAEVGRGLMSRWLGFAGLHSRGHQRQVLRKRSLGRDLALSFL